MVFQKLNILMQTEFRSLNSMGNSTYEFGSQREAHSGLGTTVANNPEKLRQPSGVLSVPHRAKAPW